MLQSMGSHRVRHDLVTEKQPQHGSREGGLSQVTSGFESWEHNEIAQVGGTGVGRGGLTVCRC